MESSVEFVRLAAAFEEFNRASATLQKSYDDLQAEAHRLSVELASTNAELERSLVEKEKVKNELKNILESLSNGVLVIGLDQQVSVCNPAALHLLGLSEPLENGPKDCRALPIPDPIKQLLERALHSEFEDVEVEIATESEPTRCIAVSGALVFDAKRQLSGATIILKDMTRLKELEMRTQQAQKLQAMGEMAIQLAHEIRNPLGSIELFASLLGSELQGSAEMRSWADQIVAGVKFLNTIVTNMLTFTRSSKPHFGEFDLVDLISETLNFIEPIFQQRDVTLQRSGLEEAIWIDGDSEMLRQMLINLFMNALQAMPEKGRLSVKLRTAGPETIEIEVEDTGIGIPPENLSRIFDPFFTTSERGTGLGLSLVHQIIEKHQGRVVAESRFGKGTRFTISLPSHVKEFGYAE
jgi:signal transduction histidine kinase